MKISTKNQVPLKRYPGRCHREGVHPKQYKSSRLGFTLVEIIVVLCLFGILSGSALWLFRQRSAETERARRRDVFQQEALRYFSHFKKDLRSATGWKMEQDVFAVSVLQRKPGGSIQVQLVAYENHDLNIVRLASGSKKTFSFTAACQPDGKVYLEVVPPVPGKKVFVVTLKGTEKTGQEFFARVEKVHAPNLSEGL